MTTHKIKIEWHWWLLLNKGIKTHEVRRADRDYQTGDYLEFEGYASRWRILHVLNSATTPGLLDGYVVLSLEHPDAAANERQRAWYADQYGKQARSNAALRGQITKLRKRIDGDS